MTETQGIDPNVGPSGSGCAECLAADGWWLHLRRCAQCGHVGCCDTSPSQHATGHANSTGHPARPQLRAGEDWYWSYPTKEFVDGPPLAPPEHHPLEQPVPAAAEKVPPGWQRHLH